MKIRIAIVSALVAISMIVPITPAHAHGTCYRPKATTPTVNGGWVFGSASWHCSKAHQWMELHVQLQYRSNPSGVHWGVWTNQFWEGEDVGFSQGRDVNVYPNRGWPTPPCGFGATKIQFRTRVIVGYAYNVQGQLEHLGASTNSVPTGDIWC